MGRGDKKTRKGKIAIGSFGKSRPHDDKKVKAFVPAEKTAAPAEEDATSPKAKK
jgi:30S ribosomal protein S31